MFAPDVESSFKYILQIENSAKENCASRHRGESLRFRPFLREPSLQNSLVSANNAHMIVCLFLNPHPRMFLLRKRERHTDIDVREKHQVVASCMCPDQGSNPQPRHVP